MGQMRWRAAVLAAVLTAASDGDARAGQYARVSDDLSLYYEDVGQGLPVVLIPGWTMSTEVFEHQLADLARTHRVIAYDPRSQGLSTKTLEHNNYAQHGRDLAALLARLDLDRVILVGWSAGCYDAYAYVRAEGTDRLAGFVCIDMPPRGFALQPGDWAAMAATPEDVADLRGGLDEIAADRPALHAELAAIMNARELSADEIDWFVRQAMLTPTDAMLALRLDWTFSDYTAEAKAMDGKIPVLQVLSEWSTAAGQPWLAANTPHAATARMKRHMSFWSEPDEFNRQLEAFLVGLR